MKQKQEKKKMKNAMEQNCEWIKNSDDNSGSSKKSNGYHNKILEPNFFFSFFFISYNFSWNMDSKTATTKKKIRIGLKTAKKTLKYWWTNFFDSTTDQAIFQSFSSTAYFSAFFFSSLSSLLQFNQKQKRNWQKRSTSIKCF